MLERAIAIAPDDATTHLLLARTLERLGRLEDAIAPLRRAIELSPSLVDAHVGLALALRRTGQLEEALRVAERAAAIAPDDPSVADARGNLLADLRPGQGIDPPTDFVVHTTPFFHQLVATPKQA